MNTRGLLATAVLAMVVIAGTVVAQDQPKVVIPAWLEAKITTLPRAKRDFLVSEDGQGFASRPELLFRRFEDKTPEQI